VAAHQRDAEQRIPAAPVARDVAEQLAVPGPHPLPLNVEACLLDLGQAAQRVQSA